MNTSDEFIANECVGFFVHVLPKYAEINMNRELHNMPSQIHAGGEISFTDDIE
jgi:hypothetical protein